MSSVPWTSLLVTAGAGTLLGYALATTQWRGAATSTSSLSRQAALEQEDDSGEDDEEYEDCKMVLVVRQVRRGNEHAAGRRQRSPFQRLAC